jgi:hypothetical protein
MKPQLPKCKPLYIQKIYEKDIFENTSAWKSPNSMKIIKYSTKTALQKDYNVFGISWQTAMHFVGRISISFYVLRNACCKLQYQWHKL